MYWSSASRLKTGGTLRWLWVSVPTILALSSLRSYPALQFLSAMVLFTAFSLIFVVSIVLLLSVLAVLGYLIGWGMTALASTVHSVLCEIRHAEISSPWAFSLFHASCVPKNKKDWPASPVLGAPHCASENGFGRDRGDRPGGATMVTSGKFEIALAVPLQLFPGEQTARAQHILDDDNPQELMDISPADYRQEV